MNVKIRDPKILDCMRGVMWSEQFRGRLEERTDLLQLLERSKDWNNMYDPKPVKTEPWKISRIGLGTFGWKYDPAIIERAIELGAGMIDTGESYGYGKVETEIGKVLKHTKLRRTWIASKVSRNHMSYSATINAAKRSRDRLNIPSIHLYQIHWYNPKYLLPETINALAQLKADGVINRVGVSNFCGGQLAWAIKLARERGFEIESNQIRLNWEDQFALDYLLPYCTKLGVRFIAYSPLGQGQRNTIGWNHLNALRWILDHGSTIYAIPQTNNVEHLEANLSLAKNEETG